MVQVIAIFFKRGFFGLTVYFSVRLADIVRTLNDTFFAKTCIFGDAMADEIDRVVAGHVLFLQEVGGVAFPFGEHGDEDVTACHFVMA